MRATLYDLDTERRDYIIRYLHLASYHARRARYIEPRLGDEADSAANWGLVEAARKYDPNRGSFGTFAEWVIRRNLWEARRKLKNGGGNHLGSRRVVPTSKFQSRAALAGRTIPRQCEDEVSDKEMVAMCLRFMTAREVDVVKAIGLDGEEPKVAITRLGRKKASFHRDYHLGLERARALLCEYERP